MAVLAPGTIDLRHNNVLSAATCPPRHSDRYVQLGRDMSAGSAKCLPDDEDLADPVHGARFTRKFLTSTPEPRLGGLWNLLILSDNR